MKIDYDAKGVDIVSSAINNSQQSMVRTFLRVMSNHLLSNCTLKIRVSSLQTDDSVIE